MRVNRTYILERYYGGLVQFIKKKRHKRLQKPPMNFEKNSRQSMKVFYDYSKINELFKTKSISSTLSISVFYHIVIRLLSNISTCTNVL